ncbi:MAG: hypothetical protein CL813_16495 [Confluentimicrobium sp.]|nr:hypothetical protein [Actibacterium sp.]MBF54516.1 hypothetical protein [Actibacterium sp.]OWU71978.1 hypothetical protein ATO2_01330 [Roseovarius sp. 22II1-1F6A]|tara:strand:+ start:848 stop:1060 length:213 start_codon:yes stop_codon:yes gene_type:complete
MTPHAHRAAVDRLLDDIARAPRNAPYLRARLMRTLSEIRSSGAAVPAEIIALQNALTPEDDDALFDNMPV